MQYLIGEIGLSLLVAALIGLFIGWLIGRFRMSREWLRSRRQLLSDIYRRDREIDHLRDDLQHQSGRRPRGASETSRSMSIAAAGSRSERSADGGYAVARRDMRDGASLTVRDTSVRGQAATKTTRARDLREATYRGKENAQRTDAQTEKAMRERLDDETHLKVQALASAGERETELKRRLDAESYEKVKALATLGELERKTSQTPQTDLNSVNTAQLKDYQRLLDQKNNQVEQLQSKVHQLLAAKSASSTDSSTANRISKAQVAQAIVNDKERILKSSLEDEAYAKVQALAQVGELERLLKEKKQTPDHSQHELLPLRRRAEQQEAIILDLRKKIDLQRNQAEVMRQGYDRKVRDRDHDITALKAEFSAGQAAGASQAEIDSYKRKLAESDRATQSQIKDFNATLEARNREYDLLGKRLEELRGQIGQRDELISKLKHEVEQAGKDRIRVEAQSNRYKEELGTLQISMKEKESSLQSLTARAKDLEQGGDAAKEVEKQLAEFTRSTEESTKKFESVILEHRNKLTQSERELDTLRKNSKAKEGELESQAVSLRGAIKDSENKYSVLQAEANRFRTQQAAADARVTQLNKELKEATGNLERAQQKISALEVKTAEFDKLGVSLEERKAEIKNLVEQEQTVRSKLKEVEAERDRVVRAKDEELAKITADLNSVQKAHENEKAEVLRFKKEVESEKGQVVQLRQQVDSDKKELQSRDSALETVKGELKKQEQSYVRLKNDHDVAIKKSADDLRFAQQKITSIESKSAEQSGAKDKEIAVLKTETAKLQTLRAELGQRDTRITTLNTDLEKLRKQKGEYDNEIARLSKEVDTAKGQAAMLQKSLDAEKQAVADRVREIDGLKSVAGKNQQQISSLQQEYQQATDKHQKAFGDLQGRFDEIQKKADTGFAERDQHLAELKEKTTTLKELAQKNASYDAEIKQLTGKLTDAEKTIQQRRDEISALKKASDEARVLAAKEKEKYDAEVRRLNEVAAQVEPLRKQTQKLETQLSESKKDSQVKVNQFMSRIQELEPWQQRYKESQQEVSDQKASLVRFKADSSAELEQKIAEINRKNTDLLTQRDKRIAELDSKAKQLDELKAEVANRDKRIGDLNQAIAQAKKDAQTNEQKLSQAEQKAKAFEGDISRLKSDHSSAGNQLKSELADKDKQLVDLKGQLVHIEKQSADQAKKAADTEARLQQELSATKKSSAGEIASLGEKVKDLDQLRKQLNKSEEEYRGLKRVQEQDGEKHSSEVIRLKSRISELEPLQQKLAGSESESKKLVAEHKAAMDKSGAEISVLKKRVSELEPLQQKLPTLEAENNKLRQSHQSTADRSRAEIESLKAEVRDLTPLKQKLTAQETENSKLAEQHRQSSEKSAAELKSLQVKIGELEPLKSQLSAKVAENEQLLSTHRTAVDKASADYAKLEARVRDLEPLTAQLDKASADKERLTTEVNGLRAQVRDLESLQKRIVAKDEELAKLSESKNAAAEQSKTDISKLQGLLTEATDNKKQSDLQLEALQKTSTKAQADTDRKLADAKAQIDRLSPLQNELKGQQAEVAKLSSQLQKSDEKHKSDIAQLTSKLQEAEKLRGEVSSREKQLASLQTQLDSLQKENSSNQAQVVSLKRDVSGKQSEIDTLSSKASRLSVAEKELSEARSSQQSYQRDLDQSARKLKTLEDSVARNHLDNENKLKALKAELASANGEVKKYRSFEQKVSAHEQTIADLKAQLAAQKAQASQLGEVRKELDRSVQQRDSDVARKDASIAKLQAEIAKLKVRPVPAAEPAKKERRTVDGKKTTRKDGADDLKLIFGIGPKIEKMLNNNGVRRFEDIAGWKQADIDKYADMLEGFSDRIERDEWVLSAQQIIDGTYNWEERRKAREGNASGGKSTDSQNQRLTADGRKTKRKDGMDDLKLIFGIGPKIEKMLNGEGVRHFEDIAGWKQADIDKYAGMLEGFSDRIERDEWVSSAQQIVDGTYNWTERKKARDSKKEKS